MRVVITGIGAVTPLGVNFRDTWESLLQGKSGISLCTRVDTSQLPWKVAGEVNQKAVREMLSEKQTRRLDPFVQYALIAAMEAKRDASIELPEDTAVVIGTSRAGISFIEQALQTDRFSAYLMAATTANMACSQVAEYLNVKGISLSVSQACASGAMAVSVGFRLIRDGYCKAVLAGASDAPITRVCLEGYGRMGVLSKTHTPDASRPFDRRRDGFVLSEGACIMVLEGLESAKKRGARVYAELCSAETMTSISGPTKPDVEDEAEVMRRAISSASVKSEDIDLVNCHATSTVLGDRVEAEAIKRVFGTEMAVTANKSQTGHMLGASSALEVALSAMSVYTNIIPPTINTKETEFSISLFDHATERPIRYVLKNSFGFGGANVALVLGKL